MRKNARKKQTNGSKDEEQRTSEYRPTLQDIDTKKPEVNYIVVPGTNIRLYDGDIVNTKYYINHWNGLFWEKRQLDNGDTIVVEENGSNVNYNVFNSAGNSYLTKTVKVVNGKAIFDAGWY